MPDVAIPRTVVIVTEAFEGVAVDRWGRLIAEAVTLRPQQLIIDLSASPLVDAAAIAVLLQAHRTLVHSGGRLILRRPVERVRRIMRLARVDQVFEVEDPSAVEAVHF